MLGSLELAMRRISDPRALKLLGTAVQAAERGAKLTAQMLAFSRKQDLTMRPVDVNEVIRRMEELLERTLGPAIHVILALDPTLWPAIADPVQLEVVLLNLAVNARDAMPSGGELRLSTRNISIEPAGNDEASLSPGDYIVLSVGDTGEGMSAEVRARAFEPFFTTKEPGKGTGLGLPQVFGFARQAGGTVALESTLGRGTIVSVYLPRSLSQHIESIEQPLPPAVSVDSLRIMLVDDDAAVRELTREMLIDLGHAVVAVESGPAALSRLATDQTFEPVAGGFRNAEHERQPISDCRSVPAPEPADPVYDRICRCRRPAVLVGPGLSHVEQTVPIRRLGRGDRRSSADRQPPFTPPAVSPATISFWISRVRSRTGAVTTSAAAASGPQLICSNVSML